MEKYSFFNSVGGDRKKFAEDFAEYFNSFIANGIFAAGTSLFTTANNDLTVTVTAGKAWINGYFYHNTDSFNINVPLPDAVLSRIDRVVIRLDMTERKVGLKLLKGTPSSTPQAPEIKRTGDYYDLCIADISVIKGAISITQANISDNRLINSLCGLVRCPVDRIPTETLLLQFEQYLREQRVVAEAEITTMLEQLHQLIDGDTVGMLIERIESHKADTTIHTSTEEKTAITEAISKNTQDIAKNTTAITQTAKDLGGHANNQAPHLITLTHSKSSTVHTLTGIPTTSGIYTAQFKATADYLQGNTFNGYTAKPVGEDTAMPNKAFVTGDLVTVVVDTQSKKLGFKLGGGGVNDTLPSQVKNLTATAGNAKVTLSWTNSTTGFAGLLIMRKVGSQPIGVKDGAKVYEGTGVSFVDTGVINDTTYYYRVFPYNAKKQYQTDIVGAVVSALPRAEPTGYVELQRYTSSGTWTCPEDNWYKIHAIGAGGAGGATPVAGGGPSAGTTRAMPGGGGGGAGGIAIHQAWIAKGQQLSVMINTAITSTGGIFAISATSGQNGGASSDNTSTNIWAGGTGGTGGIASGGNISNSNGGAGGSGGNGCKSWDKRLTHTGQNGAGFNGGLGGTSFNYYHGEGTCLTCGGGGGGGATPLLNISKYTGTTGGTGGNGNNGMAANTNGKSAGIGCGAGGAGGMMSYNGSALSSILGGAGLLIIEKGVYS